MCGAEEAWADEAREEGRLEGTVSSVRNLMETQRCTLDYALEALKVPKEYREPVREKLM